MSLRWAVAAVGFAAAAHAADGPAFNSLHSFNGGTDPSTGGAQPFAGLVRAPDGNFYGTSQVGGSNDVGTVYRMTPDGTVTTVHSFGPTGGNTPVGNLTVGSDGALYGTTSAGGRCGFCGTVFKIDTEGRYSVVHGFSAAAEGATPSGGLLLANDGNFYGTLFYGGTNRNGALFRMTPAGEVKVVHAFGASAADGASPRAPVIQASDGKLYGTTALGGVFSAGTVYQVTPAGGGATVRILHSFDASDLDGYAPVAALVQGSDGALYGNTSGGGIENVGTLYRISRQGAFRKLHTFSYATGALPAAAMILGSDGALYGTTQSGGPAFSGTVFRFGTDGSYRMLHAFGGPDGSAPSGPVLQVGADSLIGTTTLGGDNSAGTIFGLSLSGR
ncbi:MAG TPA: choice-of-anchor tandem repeat GloVer-containing protein [Ideonella sp.]|nr:choice-of-anchor tandem repeat GloVer-containing protein [Ideonella sp.]